MCLLCFIRWPRKLNALQTSENMQIEKAPANQENIFISLTVEGENAHNTTPKKLFAVRFFFWLCCEHLQRVYSN